MGVLFVPVAVEAYVTNDQNRKDKEIAPVSPDYEKLKNVTQLGGKLEPKPFESLVPLGAGVHLHFILPDAFTHAVTGEDGALNYPRIPNRWLVTRLVADQKIHQRSWIVESDYLGLDNTDSVAVPYLTDKECPYRRLGRSYSAEKPPAPAEHCLDKLTAVGPGDPTFAAYYPNCYSVLGFHDCLDDLSYGDLTYFVMGYYSDEKQDPLYGLNEEEYLQYLAGNQWSVAGESVLAKTTVCHGMVYSLPWRGPAAQYASNTPTGEINAAIGNTSVEALSALISDRLLSVKKEKKNFCLGPDSQEDSEALERFLTIMQYDLLDQLNAADGVAETEDLLQGEEFEPCDGGTVWRIRLKGNKAEDKNTEIPEDTGVLLTLLNEAQAALDTQNAALSSRQQELFCAWQRYVDLKEDPPAPWVKPKPSEKEILAELNRLCDEIDVQKDRITQIEAEVAQAQEKMEQKLLPAKDDLYLEQITGAAFYRARDPVVLLGGKGISRPFAFGQDGRFNEDETLTCRNTLVDGLVGQKCILDSKDILAYCDSFTNTAEHFAGLLCEAICLSPEFVSMIAVRIGEATLSARGQLPSPIASSAWEQPWISLFLEWSLDWLPTRTDTSPDNSLSGWKFEDIDYLYDAAPSAKGSTYTGRTVLTPHSTLLLKNVLLRNMERYKEDEELYKELVKALNEAQNLSVLSQQLGGMWTRLLSMRETLQLPIVERQEYRELAAKVEQRLWSKPSLTVNQNEPFFPIRAGFLQVNTMNIINTFGLRQLINSSLKKTICSEEVRSKYSQGMYAPRFAQGARLTFDWISRDNDRLVSCLDPATSPVCGFLYPDFLDHSLFVYEADGTFKGILKLVYRNKSRQVRWISAPGEPAEFDRVIFQTAHLKNFASALLQYNTEDDPAFYGLMYLIENRMDETCSYCESGDLLSMWSRPLVLARARMALELYGGLWYAQGPDEFAKKQTYEYERVKVPVYLGDISRSQDGSIGFFPDSATQYQNLHCVYHTDKLPIPTDYLLYNEPLCLSAADQEYTCFTVLMEAGAAMSLRCGMLPAMKKSIPEEHIEKVLPGLSFSFEVNPIVSSMEEIALPLYSQEEEDFLWYYSGKDGYVDKGSVTQPANVFADSNPVCMEGFLRRKERKP